MDLLYEAALKYKELMNKDYHIKAVYKDEVLELSFLFLPEHFYHLVGFQKLLDMRQLTKPSFLYTRIISKKITFDSIKESKFLDDMYSRMRDFYRINEIIEHLKSGEIIIEFSQRNRTRIRADFLLYDLVDGSYAHLFLRKDEQYGYIPCSFFCRTEGKYIQNNKKYRVKEFTITDRKKKPKQ